MANVQHSALTTTDLHEPKGASTASANQVYVSDGVGSGAWQDYVLSSTTIVVTDASQLSGTLDSSKIYLVDGEVDMGGTTITVPSGGLTIKGLGIDASGLVSSNASYTMFNGGGNLFLNDLYFDVSGTGSQVFDLVGVSNFEAIEIVRVNFNNCTSLGEIDGYRQGLEDGTGRFGGTPALTFSGAWAGGYAIRTSIVRILSAGMTGALFKEGTTFTMGSRFFSDANVDLPASAAFCDFQASNFTADSLFQLRGMIITRNGVRDASDSNITPNLVNTELESSFRDNQGIPNTHEGGELVMSTQAATTIGATSTFVTVAGTWSSNSLEHFDSPSNGQLRNLGADPREFWCTCMLSVEGATANDDIQARVRVFDSSASTWINYPASFGQVGNFTGGRDVVQLHIQRAITMDQNDYAELQVANVTSTANLTVEDGSFFIIQRRAQ